LALKLSACPATSWSDKSDLKESAILPQLTDYKVKQEKPSQRKGERATAVDV